MMIGNQNMKKVEKKDYREEHKQMKNPSEEGEVVRGRIFVGELMPGEFSDHDLTEFFSQFGQVTHSVVIRSQGYGFVTFSDEGVVTGLLSRRQPLILGGRRLVLRQARRRRPSQREAWVEVGRRDGGEAEDKEGAEPLQQQQEAFPQPVSGPEGWWSPCPPGYPSYPPWDSSLPLLDPVPLPQVWCMQPQDPMAQAPYPSPLVYLDHPLMAPDGTIFYPICGPWQPAPLPCFYSGALQDPGLVYHDPCLPLDMAHQPPKPLDVEDSLVKERTNLRESKGNFDPIQHSAPFQQFNPYQGWSVPRQFSLPEQGWGSRGVGVDREASWGGGGRQRNTFVKRKKAVKKDQETKTAKSEQEGGLRMQQPDILQGPLERLHLG